MMKTLATLMALCAAASLSGCATVGGTQIQAECERSTSTFPDLVTCTRDGVTARAPARLNDPKGKLYMLRGDVLAQEVKAGRKTDAEARMEWQKMYVELWEPSPQEKAARIIALGQLQQQPTPAPYYQIVQPVPMAPAPSIAPLGNNTVSAIWTGKSQAATSVTGVIGTNCQYSYAGRTFWRMFQGSCPSSVDAR